MRIKAIINAKTILLSFILVSLLITSICYAIPAIQSSVCDVTIISRNQTEYEFLPVECMDYNYYTKNCSGISNITINEFIMSEDRRVSFIYEDSVLEVNKTYRIRAAYEFGNLYDVHLITDSNTDLLTATKSVCQADNFNVEISHVIGLLVIAAVLFIIWRIYKKSKPTGIIIFILLLIALFFIFLFYYGAV